MKPHDTINPTYYTRFTIEPADFVSKNNIKSNHANVLKYILRAGSKLYPEKSKAESWNLDMAKALNYLKREVRDATLCKEAGNTQVFNNHFLGYDPETFVISLDDFCAKNFFNANVTVLLHLMLVTFVDTDGTFYIKSQEMAELFLASWQNPHYND